MGIDIITIKENTVQSFLEGYGLYVKVVNNNKLKVIDAYPSFPETLDQKLITKVNNGDPTQKENWLSGVNTLTFDNDDTWEITLEEFNWDKIIYQDFISANYLIIQCISFKKNIEFNCDLDKKNILLDLRFNFGGELSEMWKFYNEFIELCEKILVSKIIVLVSNTTCSSAELFVEKLSHDNRSLIIGSKTYGKKYAYKQVINNKTKFLIPKLKLDYSFKVDEDFALDQYYPIKSLVEKSTYQKPQLLILR